MRINNLFIMIVALVTCFGIHAEVFFNGQPLPPGQSELVMHSGSTVDVSFDLPVVAEHSVYQIDMDWRGSLDVAPTGANSNVWNINSRPGRTYMCVAYGLRNLLPKDLSLDDFSFGWRIERRIARNLTHRPDQRLSITVKALDNTSGTYVHERYYVDISISDKAVTVQPVLDGETVDWSKTGPLRISDGAVSDRAGIFLRPEGDAYAELRSITLRLDNRGSILDGMAVMVLDQHRDPVTESAIITDESVVTLSVLGGWVEIPPQGATWRLYVGTPAGVFTSVDVSVVSLDLRDLDGSPVPTLSGRKVLDSTRVLQLSTR